MIYSGYSGEEYGLWDQSTTLRYAYGDTPLGPWKSGGVIVDSRGPVPNQDGSGIAAANWGHNTHGSILEINGQWYVFYHRPTMGNGHARQGMVAPVKVTWDEESVENGGKVVITGYDPYNEEGITNGLRRAVPMNIPARRLLRRASIYLAWIPTSTIPQDMHVMLPERPPWKIPMISGITICLSPA